MTRSLQRTLLAMSLFLLFYISEGFALGLGEIRVRSYLNEPLLAEIPLIGVKGPELNGMVIKPGDPNAYQQLGLDAPLWLHHLKFEVVLNEQQPSAPHLKLTTPLPIKEPFVDLLVELNWPGDQLIREYTILLDPPSSNTLARKRRVPTQKPFKQSIQGSKTGTAQKKASQQYGPVENESLWQIARHLVENTPYSVHQGMVAIAKNNPEAFSGNISALKKGAVLNLPSQEALGDQTFSEAAAYVHSQLLDWEAKRESTAQPEIAPIPAPAKPLRLVTPIEPNERHPSQITETQQLSNKLSLVEEAVDTLNRTNKEMLRQNDVLKSQNQTLTALLQEKEVQLRTLNETLARSNDPSQGNTSPSLMLWLCILLGGAAATFLLFLKRTQVIGVLRDTFETVKAKGLTLRSRVGGVNEESQQAQENPSVSSHEEAEYVVQVVPPQTSIEPLKDEAEPETKLLAEARNLIVYEKYAKAEKVLHQLLKEMPNDIQGYLTLLELYVLTERYTEFEGWFEKLPTTVQQDEPGIYTKLLALREKVLSEKPGAIENMVTESEIEENNLANLPHVHVESSVAEFVPADKGAIPHPIVSEDPEEDASEILPGIPGEPSNDLLSESLSGSSSESSIEPSSESSSEASGESSSDPTLLSRDIPTQVSNKESKALDFQLTDDFLEMHEGNKEEADPASSIPTENKKDDNQGNVVKSSFTFSTTLTLEPIECPSEETSTIENVLDNTSQEDNALANEKKTTTESVEVPSIIEDVSEEAPNEDDALVNEKEASVNRDLPLEETLPAVQESQEVSLDLPQPEIIEQENIDDDHIFPSAGADVAKDPSSQLSLAQAFIAIGDIGAAKQLLKQVLTSGDEAQRKQVQLLLDHLEKD